MNDFIAYLYLITFHDPQYFTGIQNWTYCISVEQTVKLFIGEGEFLAACSNCHDVLQHQERYLEEVRENLQRPVNTMTQIDCQGFLCKYSDRAGAWRSYYLVLKDASLYIYEDRNDLRALGN